MQNEKRSNQPLRGLGALLVTVLLGACGGDSSSGGFQAPREKPSGTNPVAGGDRFTMPSQANPGGIVSGAPGAKFEWDTPPGWAELPQTMTRSANFRVAGNEKAECYLVLLGGDSGGLQSNVDRWRDQISLPPLPPAETAALQHVMLLGRDAVVVDFAGTWKGMSGTNNDPNWRLIGALQIDAAGSAFLKMTGPDALIEAEKEHFLALARSLRPSHEGFGAAPGSVQAQPAPAQPAPTQPVPGAGAPPPPMNPNDPAVASLAGQQQGFTCMAPSSWTKAPDKPTRVVTYQTPGGAECYVTVIGGDAGGVGANINRWRDQMGCAGLPAEELEKLEKLAMLGTQGTMVAIEGAGAKAGQEMLGAMALVGGRSVFVKMTGAKDAVLKETENFKALAQSLKESK